MAATETHRETDHQATPCPFCSILGELDRIGNAIDPATRAEAKPIYRSIVDQLNELEAFVNPDRWEEANLL